MIDTLRQYVAAGWALVRVPALSKAPTDHAWPSIDYPPEAFAPNDNVGVKLGAKSHGLVDVDLDCHEAVALAPAILPGPTATFGRPGKPRSHYLYRCATKTRKPARWMIELRSDGCQTIIPPSTRAPDDAFSQPEPIAWSHDAVAPMAVDENVLVPAFGKLAAASLIARVWPDVQRVRAAHDLVLAIAGALWHAGWSHEDAASIILPAAALHGGDDNGHREQAIASTWEGDDKPRTGWPRVAQILGPSETPTLQRMVALVPAESRHVVDIAAEHGALTDAGNAERFASEHRDTLRHAPGVGWLRWDGRRWATTSKPIPEAIASARAIAERGRQDGNAVLAKWGVTSEARSRLDATIALAETMPTIRVDPAALDADPWALCVANGTLDLRTGELRPHDPEDLITKLAPVPYDASAPCPRFDRFLGEVFSGDVDLALYVLRYLGYSLTGVIREHALGLWHGPQGRNGKGTLLGVAQAIMGDYATTIAPHVLMSQAHTQHPTSLMRLRGVRLAVAQEVNEGRQWNEALVKTLTGGDRITAHYMRQDEVTFEPTHKLVVAVNARPRVLGSGDAFWSRVHLVPWLVSFAGREQTDLADALKAEAPGILRLLVMGCTAWQQHGLRPPRTVLAHVDEYKRSQDTIGAFLRACTYDDGEVAADALYARYRSWSSMRGEHTLPASAFARVLVERGLDVTDERVRGVRLR